MTQLDFSFLTWEVLSSFVAKGLWFSIQLTFSAMIGGIVLGTILALMRLSGKWWLERPAAIYVDTLRSIPLVMVILWFFLLIPYIAGPLGAEKTALIWEGEPGDTRSFTYRELHAEVGRAANALKALGVGKGDRVAIYLPMVVEAAIAMLACARIGAPHSVVFGGFSAESLRDRIRDAEAKLLITADGGYRRGGIVAT